MLEDLAPGPSQGKSPEIFISPCLYWSCSMGIVTLMLLMWVLLLLTEEGMSLNSAQGAASGGLTRSFSSGQRGNSTWSPSIVKIS